MTRRAVVTSFADIQAVAPRVAPPNPADPDVVRLCDAHGCSGVADTLHLDAPRDVLAHSARVLLACPNHDPGGRYLDLADWFAAEPHSMRSHLVRKIDGERLVQLVDAYLIGDAA